MITLNPHAIDIFGNTRGRDQLVMKLDRAVDFVRHLDQEAFAASDVVFLDPFSKAGEVLFASALLSATHNGQTSSTAQIAAHLYAENRFFAIAPNCRSYCLSLLTFGGREKHADNLIINGNYLCENSGKLNKKEFQKQLLMLLQRINNIGNKKVIIVSNLPCQRKDDGNARFIYNTLVNMLIHDVIEQMLVTVPERWFNGTKKLTQFEEIKSGRIKYIRIKNSRWIFPTFGNREGVCFVYGDADHEGGSLIVDSGSNRTEVKLASANPLAQLLKATMPGIAKVLSSAPSKKKK